MVNNVDGVDAGAKLQRVDIGEQRVQVVLPQARLLRLIKVGAALSAAFALGFKDVSSGLFLAAILAGLIAPTYRAEYLFGFVIGMTWVVGPVLSAMAGTFAATISVLAHFVLRPAALGLYKKLRAAG